MNPRLRRIAIVFTYLGLVLLALTAYNAVNVWRFVRDGERAQGVVVKLAEREDRHRLYYAPVVTFRTENGTDVRVTSRTASNPPAFAVGEHVEMIYDPLAVTDARINSFYQLWGLVLTLGLLGGLFALVGGAILVAHRVTERRKARLLAGGYKVRAAYQSVAVVGARSRRPLFQVLVQWQDPADGRMHTFHSDLLRYDPSDRVRGHTFEVYLQPDDVRRYWVDLSALPLAAPDQPG